MLEPTTHYGLKNLNDRFLLLTGKGIEIQQSSSGFCAMLRPKTVQLHAGTRGVLVLENCPD